MREIHSLSLSSLYKSFHDNKPAHHARLFCRLVRQQNIDVISAIRGHVLGDDWQDFAFDALAQHFERAKGYLYLAASEQYNGLIKIGKTGQHPIQRLQALNNESVVYPFNLISSHPVHDRHWLELCVHRKLASQGFHHAKEFFTSHPEIACELINRSVLQDVALFEAQGAHGIPTFSLE